MNAPEQILLRARQTVENHTRLHNHPLPADIGSLAPANPRSAPSSQNHAISYSNISPHPPDLMRTPDPTERYRSEITQLHEARVRDQEMFEKEKAMLRHDLDKAMKALDELHIVRSQDLRLREDLVHQLEDARRENAALKDEVQRILRDKLSNLRQVTVPLEQYTELLMVAEGYEKQINDLKSSMLSISSSPHSPHQYLSHPHIMQPTTPSATVIPPSHTTPNSSATNFDWVKEARQKQEREDMAMRALMHQPVSNNNCNNKVMNTPQQSAPTTDGLMEPMLEGGFLFKITRELDSSSGSKHLAFYNATKDLQFTLEYTFGPNSKVSPLGDTAQEGSTFVVILNPLETKPFVSGIINGYKMALKYGPPDIHYQMTQKAVADRSVNDDIKRLHDIIERSGKHEMAVAEIIKLCMENKYPFVDFEFPPQQSSICRTWEGEVTLRPWLRPSQYLPKDTSPSLTLTYVHPNDIDQGQLGDSWFMCALSALAEFPKLVQRLFQVIVESERALGIYRVNLCKNGVWTPVVLDDYLPCAAGAPVFGRNIEKVEEMWVAITEKAYAKVHGSYESIRVGDSLDALQDLTGFPTERFDWKTRDDAAFFDKLLSFDKQGFLMVLYTPGVDVNDSSPTSKHTEEKYKAMGLNCGHAYTILEIRRCHGFQLCRIRNPWAHSGEWGGAWGDKSDMWQRHPNVRQECNPNLEGDGTFWMEWGDVCAWFDGGGTCFTQHTWQEIRVKIPFRNGLPQVMLELLVAQKSNVYIGLHQRDRRGLEASDPDRTYSAFMVSCVTPSGATGWDCSAQSHGGTFWRGRDVHLEYTFVPTTTERRQYIIPRGYNLEGVKEVWLSLFCEVHNFAQIVLKKPSEGAVQALRYNPIYKFDPSDCGVCESVIQVKGEGRKQTSVVL